MTTLLPGLLGLVLFAGFAGLIGWRIAEWPLGLVIVAAIAMAAFDLFEEVRGSPNGSEPRPRP